MNSWNILINREAEKDYFKQLKDWLSSERKSGVPVYPPENEVFAALDKTPPDKIKIVILGQDPYHSTGQANGLSFSVKEGIKLPPSLKNIYKEIEQSLNIKMPEYGDLSSWADQGVLLLNTVLTVEHSKPQSHRNRGWERFTDEIIMYLNQLKQPIIFFLWGAPAQKKKKLIDANQHIIFSAPHPSPLSAYRGFFGCEHFKKANEILSDNKRKEINWNLSQ